MAEQLALAEKVHDPSVVDELDGAVADHPQRARRFRALFEDRRPGRKALTPGSLREPRDGRGVQLVERWVPFQKRCDVAHDAYERKRRCSVSRKARPRPRHRRNRLRLGVAGTALAGVD